MKLTIYTRGYIRLSQTVERNAIPRVIKHVNYISQESVLITLAILY